MVKHYLSLIAYKARADLLAEARRGWLGALWWIVEPVLYMAVFYVVFVLVLRRGGNNAVEFLLTGLVVWKWFGSAVPMCANSIVASRGLIQQVYLPKILFPLMATLVATWKFLLVFVLLLLFLFFSGVHPALQWLGLAPLLFVQYLVILALGSMLAAVLPFLPDLKLLVDNGVMLLFFVSGIFFDITTVPAGVRFYLHWNPMAGLIENYRAVLLKGAWPDWSLLALIAAFSVVGLLASAWVLHRFDRKYAKVV